MKNGSTALDCALFPGISSGGTTSSRASAFFGKLPFM